MNKRDKLLCRIVLYGGSLLPTYMHCVLFNSFNGMYNDNPKPISELLHQKMPDYPIYWVISEKCHENIPDYIHKVRFGSLFYWILAANAKVVVDNHFGLRISYARKGSFEELIKRFPYRKRKDQLNISTWHGTPLKQMSIEKNANKDQIAFLSGTDYLVVGCEYCKETLGSASGYAQEIRKYGTPRNDILFQKAFSVTEIKRKLRLPLNKRIVLFAPTWRPTSVERSGVMQLEQLDIYLLLQELNKKLGFGEEYVFVYRVHHTVQQKINRQEMIQKYKGVVFDGNYGDDMAEYLLCTDVLITDFSGSMYDYALTGKPCFLYAPDKDQYENEVGFYSDFEQLPFDKACNTQQLIECIRHFDKNDYEIKLEAFLNQIGNIEDGHATERIVNSIMIFLESGCKE